MKPLVVLLVCLANFAKVKAHGVCYDPNHNKPADADAIRKDAQRIKEAGFKSVRTYVVKFGPDNLASLLTEQGLNVSVTIPFVNERPDDSMPEMLAAVEAAIKPVTPGAGRVTQIYVGNENLANVNAVPPKMFEFINYVKGAVPPDVLVGTVQRNTEFLEPARVDAIAGWKQLLDGCSIVGVNIHPVFTANTTAERAIDVVNDQWIQLTDEKTKQRFPGIVPKYAITEVGWPSAGSMLGNTGTKEGAQDFVNAYKTWSKKHIAEDRSFYFQMFDQPQRQDGPFEAHFGMVDASGVNKFTSFSFQDL
ncbi:hypothetical protein Poli38472_008314 [Pythium oligandrum]|uniref:glucan endo-1,3-beta-D-glucosidase n=1 Tax=Pythium oligandrum TaxID=41045 RepID=A0A8K1FNA5_PYTOL|nr:hypothetical protein Poli38472_008314 [Pythium oligandrum]|eukprot:TMW65672.1 hypothetical protein Poli38472_008314 [Pythium oligandrum]